MGREGPASAGGRLDFRVSFCGVEVPGEPGAVGQGMAGRGDPTYLAGAGVCPSELASSIRRTLFPFAVFALWAVIFAEFRSSGNIGGKAVCGLGTVLVILGSFLALFVISSGPSRVNRIELGNSLACENHVTGPTVEFFAVWGEAWWPANRVLLQREFAYDDGAERFGTCRVENLNTPIAEIPGEIIPIPRE